MVGLWTLVATMVGVLVALSGIWFNRRRVHIKGSCHTLTQQDEDGQIRTRGIIVATVNVGAQPVTIDGFSIRYADSSVRHVFPQAELSTELDDEAVDLGSPEPWPYRMYDGVRVEAGTVKSWELGALLAHEQFIDSEGKVEVVVQTILPRLVAFRWQPRWFRTGNNRHLVVRMVELLMKFGKRLATRRSLPFEALAQPLDPADNPGPDASPKRRPRKRRSL